MTDIFIEKALRVYRLEHKISGLGPYEHRENGDQLFECMMLSYHKDPDRMVSSYLIKKFRKEKWVFGWTSRQKFEHFCPRRLRQKFKKLGFVVKKYKIINNYHIFPDGQIAFIKSVDWFI